jgi:L-ascorbate metabolism protein UlaG (beta-lactamase superfamily)
MYNLQRGHMPGQLFHTKGRGNGYVLTLGARRVYVAGDTECTEERASRFDDRRRKQARSWERPPRIIR